MDRCDPLTAPEPEAWLALEEKAHIDLVRQWHEETSADVGERPALHAGFHAVVENQIAQNDPPLVAIKLRQLMAQGLDRHAALHAIISILATRVILGEAGGRRAVFRRFVRGWPASSVRMEVVTTVRLRLVALRPNPPANAPGDRDGPAHRRR